MPYRLAKELSGKKMYKETGEILPMILLDSESSQMPLFQEECSCTVLYSDPIPETYDDQASAVSLVQILPLLGKIVWNSKGYTSHNAQHHLHFELSHLLLPREWHASYHFCLLQGMTAVVGILHSTKKTFFLLLLACKSKSAGEKDLKH